MRLIGLSVFQQYID